MIIDVVSDFVCPWCFIGARRLAAAMALCRHAQPDAQLGVCWHPFFLNPDTPAQGEPYAAFMERKFGTPQAVHELHRRVAAAAAGDGIEFAFERMHVRPSTFAAHALVERVQARGLDAGALAMAIFEAHFLRGLNIGRAEVLDELLAGCGLDPALAADETRSPERFAALSEFACGAGAAGVPLFIIDGRYALSGAQPAAVLDAAMRHCLDPGNEAD